MKMEAVLRADAEQARVSSAGKADAEKRLEERVRGLQAE